MRLRYKTRASRDNPWLSQSVFHACWGLGAPLLAFALRWSAPFDTDILPNTLLYVGLAGVFTFVSFGWFRLGNSLARFFSAGDAFIIVKASVVAVVLTALTCFLINRLDTIPRAIPLLHVVLLAGGEAAGRTFNRLLLARPRRVTLKWRATENIIIVGVSELASLYIQIVERFSSGARQIVALVDPRSATQRRFVNGYPVAGRISELEQVIEEYELHGVRIHRLVLIKKLDELSPQDAAVVTKVAAKNTIATEILPTTMGLEGLIQSSSPIDSIEIDSTAAQQLEHTLYWSSKRAFDFIFAAIVFLLACPLILILMVLVLIDCRAPPLFFWQVRFGRYGNRIVVYKFRTMKAPYSSTGERIPQNQRASAFGRLLRKTRLDELPQLLSILTGQMSLIGPRPLLPADLPSKIGLRLAVRPGITGWAQANGATLLTAEEKDAMDEWYVRHASWPVDVKIMALTIAILLRGFTRNESAIQSALQEKRETSLC